MSDKHSGTKFVIITSPRCGSTWLVSLLNQLKNTTTYGEMFLSRQRVENWDAGFAYPRFVETYKARSFWRPGAVFEYLDTIYQQPGTVGFKLMYNHIKRTPELLIYLLIHRIHVIHLVRKNTLNVLISRAVIHQTQQAHRLASDPPIEGVQIELDPRTLIKKLRAKQRRQNRTRRFLRWSGLRLHEVAYEDLQSDPAVFQSMCDFLSIKTDGIMPASKFQRMRRDRQSVVLKNYGEVRQALEQTDFQVYLE
ncbi:MAG TPA: sulfotransferase domain-containing protein [Anaerolineaceae bacterium]|nr:sulfotransferase domain-containing protein [Anaerolineaceae bacterium]